MNHRPMQNDLLPSTEYWSDVLQRRLEFVDDIIQRASSLTLNDTQALRLLDEEMSAIYAGPFCMVRSRHNALTRSCRIPPEILGKIFVHYQLSSSSSSFYSQNSKENISSLYSTALWWVPAVAHVCRHWRTVALECPRLWSNIALHIGPAWATRMLELSKDSPISISMSDPDPCEVATDSSSLSWFPEPVPPKLDPLKVLSEHLLHIKELKLAACPCTAHNWVNLLETGSPLETLRLHVNPHRPGSLPDTPISLPNNFLATHLRLRRIFLENACLSSWTLDSHPLTQLSSLIIIAPDPRHATDRLAHIVPTPEQFLDCLFLMPALEELRLEYCLPYIAHKYSSRAVSLLHLHTLTLRDHVDKCHQVFSQLDFAPAATINIYCWSTNPRSERDCLRILPILSAHLSRIGPGTGNSRTGGPQALTLHSANDDARTRFVLSAWSTFTLPTVEEDHKRYFGPKGDPDVRLECEWNAGDPEMERRALLRACAGVPIAQLRALSLRPSNAVWSAHDWYDTFVDCSEITHVLAHDALAESLIEALRLSTGPPGIDDDDDDEIISSDRDGLPLFQELVSLSLVGVDFGAADEWMRKRLCNSMKRRQANPLCVTLLDHLELRACTVKEEWVDALGDFACIVVWDRITDAQR